MICIRKHVGRKLFFVDSIDPAAVLIAAIEQWHGISINPDNIEVLRDFASAYDELPYMELEAVDLQGKPIRNQKGGVIAPFWVAEITAAEARSQIEEWDLVNSINRIEVGVDNHYVQHLWHLFDVANLNLNSLDNAAMIE